jgi:iron(III) transport system substrate-binding protein
MPVDRAKSAMTMACRIVTLLSALTIAACGASDSSNPSKREVIVYASFDRSLAEPVLQSFEARSSIRVRAIYDTEANKTTGLVNRVIAEAERPQADVFWSGEIGQTLRLAERGVLDSLSVQADRRAVWSDASDRWHAMPARARVLLIRTDRVPRDRWPVSLESLTGAQWKERIAVADPHFGTTGSHLALLLDVWGRERFEAWTAGLRANAVRVLPGNAQVRDAVVAGVVDVGLTDSDDAMAALSAGAPVAIAHVVQSSDVGPVWIPGTVARVRGGPNPSTAAELVRFLLSSETDQTLSASADQVFTSVRAASSDTTVRASLPIDQAPPTQWGRVAAAMSEMWSIVDAVWLDRRAGDMTD